MTISLVAIVKDEADIIGTALDSVREHISHWTIVDTGSTDRTREIVEETLTDVPGQLLQRDWVSYGANRTQALAHARGKADWLLTFDADMTAAWHPELVDWLATDPDPETDAWNIELLDGNIRHRLPLLLRGNLDWRYAGAVHEYVDNPGRKTRSLLGLTITHNRRGRRTGETDLELLRPGYENGEPRATFYTAETLRNLGRTDEAIAAYQARAAMTGWDEETWYATYQAASLTEDVDELLRVHQQRPWRHEPLAAAARIIASQGNRDDLLFIEQGP